MQTATTTKQIECRNSGCDNMFTPKNAQHGFCSEQCRRAARGAQWGKIRKAALRRDGYTCQDCTAKDCRLEVHHCIPLCMGGDNRLYNLLTLCSGCHKLRHRSWKLARTWEVMDALKREKVRARQGKGAYRRA